MPSRLSTRDWSISPESCEYDTDCRAVLLLNSWLFRQYHVHRAQPRRIKLTHHSPPPLFIVQQTQQKAGQESGGCTEEGIRKWGEDTADAECDAAGGGRGSQGGRSAALATELVDLGCVRNLRRAFVDVYAKDFRYYIACQERNMGNAKAGLPMQ